MLLILKRHADAGISDIKAGVARLARGWLGANHYLALGRIFQRVGNEVLHDLFDNHARDDDLARDVDVNY